MLTEAGMKGALVARKAETDPVSRVFGCLGVRIDTDRFIRKLRGDLKKCSPR